MTNAGDYALEYTLWIYLQRIPNTKVTATVRRHLMGTIYKVNEAVFTASVHEGVDLSTPDILVAQLQTPSGQNAAQSGAQSGPQTGPQNTAKGEPKIS